MRRRPRAQRRLPLIQVLSLALALLLGLTIIGSKVAAQAAGDEKPGAARTALSASPPNSASAPVAAPAAASSIPLAPAPRDAPRTTDETTSAHVGAKSTGATPLDYAVVQSDEDFPAGMSDEERAAVGTGKVPIHREGAFRSPFAHPRFGGPATAKVGFVLVTMREYDIQHGSFEASFFLSLTSDRPMPPISLKFPNVSSINESVIADTPTFKLYRFDGKFESPVDLRRYPFDTQDLVVEIEDQSAGVDQLVFEPNQSRTSVDEGFQLPGWSVASVGARAYKHRYPPRFDRDDLYVSRYKFSLSIDRFITSAAFSVFVPAYIIVLISLFGLWVQPEQLEVRTNAGAPMLAAAVFFHYSLTQALPATGYLTRADKLMLGVYVALLLNMATTWVLIVVREERVAFYFKLFRAWIPPLTAALMLGVSFL